MILDSLLLVLSQQLKSKGFDESIMFNKGVNESYLNEIMGSDRISLGRELLELYGWHNGSPISGNEIADSTLFCSSIFISFEYAWLSYRYFRSESFFKDRMNHFPFMQDGGGIYLFVDTDSSSKTKNMVYEYDISRFPIPYQLKFESISSLLLGTIECLKQGAYIKNVKNQIDIDFKKQNEIFQKINPSIAYWRQ